MKIMHQGAIPNPQPPQWWIGITLRCQRCATELQIEEGDNVQVVTERSPFGNSIVTVQCPTCAAQISAERSQFRLPLPNRALMGRG